MRCRQGYNVKSFDCNVIHVTLLLYFVSSMVSRHITSCRKCGSSTLIRETRRTTARCYNIPLHSGSTQLNYEWRSIPREGRRRAVRSRDTSIREELRGFRGKIKREKNIRHILSARTIQKLARYPCSTLSNQSILRNAILLCYPSLWPSWTDTLTSNLKMNCARGSDLI